MAATILIVDDRPANREWLVALLQHRGYRMLEAGDGAEALEIARRERPDLVIADILMPTMDGYELVRRLRADAGTADMVVVFYTAHFRGPEAERLAAACGVPYVLTKPAEPERVLEVVDLVLGDRAGAPTPVPEPEPEFDAQHLRLITDKLSATVDALGASNERLNAMIAIATELASEREPARLLESVCRAARELMGARHALLAVGARDAGGVAHLVVTSGMPAERAERIGRPVLSDGAPGLAYASRRPRRLSAAGTGDLSGLPHGHPPARAALIAPIMSLAYVYGWVCLTDKLGADAFSDEDERLLGILCAQVGRIYENGSLYREVHQQAEQLRVEVAERRRAAEELQESERRFRQLAGAINEVFYLYDPRSAQLLYVSPAYETVFGRSPESVYADPRSWLDVVEPEDLDEARSVFDMAARNGHWDHVYRIRRPDGELRWIRGRGYPVRDASGKVQRIAGIATDITESRLQQERIARLTRIKEVTGGINSAIARLRDRDRLLEEVCRVAVAVGRWAGAWIASADGSDGSLRLVAGDGCDIAADGKWTDDLLGTTLDAAHPAFEAARERRVVARDDLESGDITRGGADAQLPPRGSMVSLPLDVHDRTVAVLTLYAAEAHFFDREELELLHALAQDIAYGLEHIENEQRLDYVSSYDLLTGLPNRRLFMESLRWAVRQAREQRSTGLVVIIDLDRFKHVNDTLGHVQGDELLRQASQRLCASLDIRESVWRLGGDEFAMIVASNGRRIDQGAEIAAAIRAALRRPFTLAGQPVGVSASIGMAVFPDDADDADTLVKYAEMAMYEAKEAGRGGARFYTADMNRRAREQFGIEHALHRALENEEFELHYQPKARIADGQWTGVEALLRWNRPGHGMVSPAHFIPVLEETGMILPVGEWVIREASRQAGEWQRAGLSLPVAVNVSARQFAQPGLADVLAASMREGEIDSSLLEIEITESALMSPDGEADVALRRMRALGIGISIDDFGTGYSSLGYLKQFPIEKLKIDASFVRDVLTNADDAAIARAVIGIAHSLNLVAIAEGVESDTQLEFLRRAGCDEFQGYHLARPMPAADLEAFYGRCNARAGSDR